MLTSSNTPPGDGPARGRHLSRWRRRGPALTLAGLVVAGVTAIVLVTISGRPGNPDHASELVSTLIPPTVDLTTILVRAVLITATATIAGLALARVLLDRTDDVDEQPRQVRTVAWVAAVATAAGCVAAVLTDQAARPVAALQLALSLAVPLVIADRRRVWPTGLAGVALAGMLAVEFSTGRSVLPVTLEVIYVIAGAVLLGSSVFGVALLPGRADLHSGHGVAAVDDRLRPIALSCGIAVTAAGLAHLLIAGPHTVFDVLHTGRGVAGLTQAVLPVLVTAAWVLATAPRTRPRAELVRLSTGTLTLSVLAAAMVATFPLPLTAPQPGTPLLRPVDLGLRHLALLVLPMRPGPNLVHIGDGGGGQPVPEHHHGPAQIAPPGPITITTGSDTAPVPVVTRPGAPGGWAVVNIPAGTDRLQITADGITATVPVDVGATAGDPAVQAALTGPDGPECASAALGALLAEPDLASTPIWDHPSVCPSQTLSTSDAGALRDTVTFLAGRGIRALHLVADDSPRSHAAADLVRAEAGTHHLPISTTATPGDTLLAVSGWATATDALAVASKAANGEPGGGIVLAPWLLTTKVLGSSTSEVVALPFNPQNDDTREYASTVNAVFPGETPSTGGYLAWAAQHRTPLDARDTFYGAAQVNVPMGMDDDMNMSGQPSDWYLGGSVVPINPPLATPTTAPTTTPSAPSHSS